MEKIAFTIILHAGNARSLAMEAIKLAKADQITEAADKIALAESEFTKAHHEQTTLLQREAEARYNHLPLILIHAQDHLMMAMTVKDLAVEFIDMYQKLHHLEGEK
ncbi:PTS lactose/cellobiose transporter subunit IIA [Gracilibacillus caseinilyticus]|uniref:PTS lactose/cellobiose transporter subunit IIA n=1 Tax=Gracilibacillus caseinilyticus TaxID=2932256 RepID=A0ABY4F1M4_9BACI|nr:PTS lactose/cellobiose transporter subunit IIA [Gracilibacillus caseinilyticus]UOQ50575.1 PTS lactose/cellobiose transporter subunit IIA [Gracilibacillus caseinilyticus]